MKVTQNIQLRSALERSSKGSPTFPLLFAPLAQDCLLKIPGWAWYVPAITEGEGPAWKWRSGMVHACCELVCFVKSRPSFHCLLTWRTFDAAGRKNKHRRSLTPPIRKLVSALWSRHCHGKESTIITLSCSHGPRPRTHRKDPKQLASSLACCSDAIALAVHPRLVTWSSHCVRRECMHSMLLKGADTKH